MRFAKHEKSPRRLVEYRETQALIAVEAVSHALMAEWHDGYYKD